LGGEGEKKKTKKKGPKDENTKPTHHGLTNEKEEKKGLVGEKGCRKEPKEKKYVYVTSQRELRKHLQRPRGVAKKKGILIGTPGRKKRGKQDRKKKKSR